MRKLIAQLLVLLLLTVSTHETLNAQPVTPASPAPADERLLFVHPKTVSDLLEQSEALLRRYQPESTHIQPLSEYKKNLDMRLVVFFGEGIALKSLRLDQGGTQYQIPVWHYCKKRLLEAKCTMLNPFWLTHTRMDTILIGSGGYDTDQNEEPKKALASMTNELFTAVSSVRGGPYTLHQDLYPHSNQPVFSWGFSEKTPFLPSVLSHAYEHLDRTKGALYWTKRALDEHWKLGAMIDKDPLDPDSLVGVFIGAKVKGQVKGALLKVEHIEHEAELREAWSKARDGKVIDVGALAEFFYKYMEMPLEPHAYLAKFELTGEYTPEQFLDPEVTVDIGQRPGWGAWEKENRVDPATGFVTARVDKKQCLFVGTVALGVCGKKQHQHGNQTFTLQGTSYPLSTTTLQLEHQRSGWYALQGLPIAKVPLADTSLAYTVPWVVKHVARQTPTAVWHHLATYVSPTGLIEIAKGIFTHGVANALGVGWIMESKYVYQTAKKFFQIQSYLYKIWTAKDEFTLAQVSDDIAKRIAEIVLDAGIQVAADQIFKKVNQAETVRKTHSADDQRLLESGDDTPKSKRGGLAPILQGNAYVKIFIKQIKEGRLWPYNDQNVTIIEQIYIRVPYLPKSHNKRRVDVLTIRKSAGVENVYDLYIVAPPPETREAFEVKSGSSNYDAMQRLKDHIIATHGGTFIGKVARKYGLENTKAQFVTHLVAF